MFWVLEVMVSQKSKVKNQLEIQVYKIRKTTALHLSYYRIIYNNVASIH